MLGTCQTWGKLSSEKGCIFLCKTILTLFFTVTFWQPQLPVIYRILHKFFTVHDHDDEAQILMR